MHAFGVHWGLRGGLDLLSAVAGFDLPFARVDKKYTFCLWLVLGLEKDAAFLTVSSFICGSLLATCYNLL